MTYFCNECTMNWHPYQCIDGACPECGGGTRRTHDPASDDVDVRHREALAERIKRERYERFEAYYFDREVRANGLDELLVATPRRLTPPRCPGHVEAQR